MRGVSINTDPGLVLQAYYEAIDRITEDILSGVVPASQINSFSDLHEHVDANAYVEIDGPSRSHSDIIRLTDVVQQRLDRWITSGLMTHHVLEAQLRNSEDK